MRLSPLILVCSVNANYSEIPYGSGMFLDDGQDRLMKVKLKRGRFEDSPESITSADAYRRLAVIHNPPMIVAVILMKT